MLYDDFDPFRQYGDYVEISNDNPVLIEEARNLCKEQIKCKIPFDFEKHIVITVKREGPSPHDPLAQRARVTWKYTPPPENIMSLILTAARRRADRTRNKHFPWGPESREPAPTIKFRRYDQFKPFEEVYYELKDNETS